MKFSSRILFILFTMVTISTYSLSTERRLQKDAISLGMGGVGVSTFGYQFSAMRNPAALGLMTDHDIAPFLTIGASINPEMMELISTVSSVVSGDKSVQDINYDGLIDKAPTVGLNGPLNLGYMGKGFGFWVTSGADATAAIVDNPNNFLTQSGLNIPLNSIAKFGVDFMDYYQKNNGSVSQDEIMSFIDKHLGADLNASGLTDAEIQTTIQELAKEMENNPDLIKKLLPLARYSAMGEIAVNLAYGYRIPFAFLDEVSGLSLGATIRFAQRFLLTSGEFTTVDSLDFSFDPQKNIYQAGSISSDFGIALRLENFVFATTVRDALSSEFQWKNFSGEKGVLENSQIPYSVDFGASYRFYFNNKFIQEVGVYLEFEDATSALSSWYNKMRVGSEVKLFNFLDLRVGMYSGFLTAGIGMGWKWFRMDFAYYREKYFNVFTSDQFYFNMTVGLDNSPRRKAASVQKQLQQDRAQVQALELVNQSLEGVQMNIPKSITIPNI